MNTTEGWTLPILANAIAAFRHAPEWGGVLAFNEFGFGTVALRTAPWGIVPKGEWTDHEDRLAAEWLQKQGILVSVEIAGQAVQTTARDHPFHPVRTYLKGPQWDGVERLDRWLLRRGSRGFEVADFKKEMVLPATSSGPALSLYALDSIVIIVHTK